MPASLIIIAALTCFILWFRCLLLSIALGYDLQWQVLEVRRWPLRTQLQLVEAEMCCGLSLKGSYMFLRKALPCFKQLGRERPGPACPILPRWPVLSIPSDFMSPPSTSQHEKSRAKTFTLCLFLLKAIWGECGLVGFFCFGLSDWSCKGRSRSNVNILP